MQERIPALKDIYLRFALCLIFILASTTPVHAQQNVLQSLIPQLLPQHSYRFAGDYPTQNKVFYTSQALRTEAVSGHPGAKKPIISMSPISQNSTYNFLFLIKSHLLSPENLQEKPVILSDKDHTAGHNFQHFETGILAYLITPESTEIGQMNTGSNMQTANTMTETGMFSHNSAQKAYLPDNTNKENTKWQQEYLLTSLFLLILSFGIIVFLINRRLHRQVQKKSRLLDINESRFRQLINNLPQVAIKGYNSKREIIFWNTSSEKLYGYHEKEARGKQLEKLIVPQDNRNKIIDIISNMIESGISPESSVQLFQDKAGNPLNVHCSHLILENQDSSKEMYCITFDYSSTIRAKEEKKKSEARYQILFETMHEGFALHEMIFDSSNHPVDYIILAVNPAFEKLTGYNAANIVGRKATDIFPDHSEQWISTYSKLVSTGKPEKFIDHTIKIDNYFEVAAFRPQEGQFACFFKDITETKKAEDRAIYLASLLDHVTNGIFVTSGNGTILYWNKYAEFLYQYSAAEAIGKSLNNLILPQESMRKVAKCTLDRKIHGRWEGEIIHKRKDGTLFPAYITETSIQNESGTDNAVLSISLDMTEQNNLQKQLRQSQKLETIGTLAGGIAHDFNNILGAIIGYAEIAEDELPDFIPGKEYIPEILKASNRAKELVSQILKFSRKSDEKLVPMDLGAILEESLLLIKATAPSSVNIRYYIAPDAGHILGSPIQIHQVCTNLCTNAIQSMEKNGGNLTLKVDKQEAKSPVRVGDTELSPGSYIVLAIEDCGAGIDTNGIDRIFDPYFTTKEIGKGSGLGLSVVQGIIKTHGGFISVESELDKGTTFKIYFPEISKKILHSVVTESSIVGGDERILLVDDEKSIVRISTRILERLGYSVTGINESIKAFEIFHANPFQFDLLITDQTMPYMSGTELIKALHDIRPELPVILCTGYNNLIDEDDAQVLGIQTFLMKPLGKKELAKAVRSTLNMTITN